MALRGRGLQFDDHDYQPEDYGRTDFKADRKKTNFQKGMDDLLFGGPCPPPKRPRKQQPKSEKVVKKQSPPKQADDLSDQSYGIGLQSYKSGQKSKFSSSKSPSKNPQSDINEKPSKSENRNSKPIVNNYVKSSQKHQEQSKQKKQAIVEQPKPYYQEDIIREEQQSIYESMNSFNRPIRKSKTSAENFEFAQQNVERHVAYDVVRPSECLRDIVRRQNTPFFSDIEFPPESASIGFEHRAQWILFKKPEELHKSPAFGKYIDPNDIQPGSMSSPQFLSTLSCLAEKQNHIKRLIEDQKINPNGFYYVRLNVNGVWRYICVDDYLPESDGKPIGARSQNDSEADLWASIIEKAYAKVYGGYNAFKRLVTRESYLRDLTGAPVRSYLMTNSDIFHIINNALGQGYPVIAVPSQKIVDLGLNPNYSLAVLKCSSKGALELRNSWGTTTEKANVSLSKQGIFQLSSSYTADYISHILIAYTDPELCTSTIQSKHHKSFYSAYSFSIDHDSRGYISISQLDERLFSPKKDYSYSPFRLIIVRKTQKGESIYVNAGFSHHSRNLDVQVNLTEGHYHIYCIGSWLQSPYDYNLTVSCYQNVELKKVYYQNFPNIIAQSLAEENVRSGRKVAKGNVDEYILYHQPTNLILITALNSSEKKFKYTQDMSQIKFSGLTLINTINPEYTFEKKRKHQLEQYKLSCLETRNWQVELSPKQKFTWVISNAQEYKPSNYSSWGFK